MVDEGGLSAPSTRKLGGRLGVEAMTLYPLNGLSLMVLGLAAGEVNPPVPEGPAPERADAEAAFRAMLAPLLGGGAAFDERHERIFDVTLEAFVSGLANRLKLAAPSG